MNTQKDILDWLQQEYPTNIPERSALGEADDLTEFLMDTLEELWGRDIASDILHETNIEASIEKLNEYIQDYCLENGIRYKNGGPTQKGYHNDPDIIEPGINAKNWTDILVKEGVQVNDLVNYIEARELKQEDDLYDY